MPIFPRSRSIALVLSAVLFLGACDSAEERAEEHFQSGLELLESGDVDRAIVEFRNVFSLNATHLEARRKLAEVLLEEKGNKQSAYRQYLRIAEQYPDDLDTRLILTEIALTVGNWDEVDRHGSHAQQLAPEEPRVKAVALAQTYRDAARKEDAAQMRDIARSAETLLQELPDSTVLRSIRVDAALRENDFTAALEDIDWLLERDPDNQQMLRQRLNVLAQLGDDSGVEEQLRDMIARFPETDTHKATLLRFYLSRGLTDKAENYLREMADAAETPGPKMDLVRFLMEVRGTEAARDELGRIIAAATDPMPFQILLAAMDFEAGERDTAIASLEAVVRDAPDADTASVHNAKMALARMQLATGNEVGARARVAEVLAADGDQPEALKLQAAWEIEADQIETAIQNIRTVLDRAPEDAQAMTLMAQAYERSGRLELARDFMALAVEASGNAPAETIRYARVLIGEEKYLPAEDILLTALRFAPQDFNLLITLGDLYLRMEDMGRVEQVAATLRTLDIPNATQAANEFDARRISRQSGTSDALAFLEGLAEGADAPLTSRIALVRARLGTGDLEGALQVARSMHEETPDNLGLTQILASTEALAGNLETADALYRSVLDENPQIAGAVWLELSRLKVRQEDPQAARAVIREGLGHLPENGNLLWAQASYMERDGDIDGAIAIYESLYERNSNSLVVANNLASLLATYRDDEESLERAWVVARRFRNSEIPAMQDTYGWTVHRRGNSEEALPYLEAAAAGLPDDPIVQYHLAQVYLAQERPAEALEQFRKAVEIAGPADQRVQIESAREQVRALQTRVEN